jgi:hemolysin III
MTTSAAVRPAGRAGAPRPRVARRPNDTRAAYLKRTIAAQIHLLGFALAAAGAWVLVSAAARAGRVDRWACLAYGAASMLVFGVSAVYHFLHDGHAMAESLADAFETLDHCAIYLFIAATYTPFLLNAVAAPRRGALLAAVWASAAAGILYTVLRGRLPAWARRRRVYTALFVLMGWILVLRLGDILRGLDARGLLLLGAGALSYTVGAVVYATRRPRLVPGVFGSHELWHLLVLLGYAFHYFLILGFYTPS